MKRKEDLFHLIKAMSRTEKRYFTLDAQKTGRKGSKYLELFHAVNAMDSYDERILKDKFPKHLSSDKAYLYEAILRSMRDYRSSKSKVAQIKEMIMDSKYLYERGLYDQCEERLAEAKRLATELDDQLARLEIIKEERRVVRDRRRPKYEETLSDLMEESVQSVTSIKEELHYLGIYDQLSTEVIRHPDLTEDDQQELVKSRFSNLIENLQQVPDNIHARRRFFQSAALYYQLVGDFDQVFDYYTKVVDWWDENPKYKSEEFYRYIVDIANLLFICLRKQQYGKFPELLDRIEREPPGNLHDQKIAFQKLAIYKLVYFINSGRSAGAHDLVDEIERGLAQFSLNPVSQLILSGNVAILLFIIQDFEGCIAWCERIIRNKRLQSRYDIQKGMHLLFMVALLELEDLEAMESALRMTKRFFKQRPETQVTHFESIVYSYLQKLYNAPVNAYRQALSDFRERIKAIKADPNEKVSFGLDDLLLHWVTSKLEQKSILQQIGAATS
jgi:tetratricopeptide (TPR) repeat protein